eukprot:COSAG02_NODE_42446_length_384_cov_1.087719_1_plen_63_part_10
MQADEREALLRELANFEKCADALGEQTAALTQAEQRVSTLQAELRAAQEHEAARLGAPVHSKT